MMEGREVWRLKSRAAASAAISEKRAVARRITLNQVLKVTNPQNRPNSSQLELHKD